MNDLWSWIAGDLSPAARVSTALAPALLLAAVAVLGLVPFAVRVRLRGLPADPETRRRGRSVLVGFFLRHYFFWLVGPLLRLVLRSRLPADALTTLAVLLGAASGVAVAAGRFALGGWLFLTAGVLDALDGRVARQTRTATAAGNALDSVLDRVSDAAILVGLGWYYRDGPVLLLVLAALVGTSLVPYVRAKGEALGVTVRGGLLQRPERVLFLGASVALSPVLEVLLDPYDPHPAHRLAIVGVALVAVLGNVTWVSRLVSLQRRLSPAAPRRRSSLVQVALHGGAAAAATALDYVVVVLLVEQVGLAPTPATGLGCVAGAIVNFGLNRTLIFRGGGALAPQAGRYAAVSLSSALLNMGGVALMALHPALDYRLGWWFVRGLVWLGWNYPLHRDYVFGGAPRVPAAGMEESRAA